MGQALVLYGTISSFLSGRRLDRVQSLAGALSMEEEIEHELPTTVPTRPEEI